MKKLLPALFLFTSFIFLTYADVEAAGNTAADQWPLSDADREVLKELEEIVEKKEDSASSEETAKAGETETDESEAEEPEIEYTIDPDNYSVPMPERKSLSLKGADRELTKKYISQYQSDINRQWLTECLMNSIPYRPYIRQKLKEYNMPMELQYLPVVESNYRNNAVSRAGATGMWQFMENSMSPFLKKNSWYDQRRDPWLSTDAALSKLRDNYKMFGDWEIAIAAYNCGAGAMRRILKQYPGKDFWYLAEHGILRQQTALYVPKLVSIAELAENAEYYGMLELSMADKLIENKTPEKYDYVTVAGMLSLKQISQITGIQEDTLTFLNPALLRNCTPAGEKYSLRLPSGTKEAAEKALKENSIPTDAVIYTVKKGDSLWAISRQYGVSVKDLCTVNNIKESAILSIGQKIIIPVFK